jgi:L-ascorbate metabolism protein UlaG (beta-lactamase superfamily)
MAVDDLPPLDAVLLTHDHHGDNLDDAGRELLASVGTVLTTRAGARRLGAGPAALDTVQGMRLWDPVRLEASDKPAIEVIATPCRHGPPLSGPIVGDVIGFALRWDGQQHGALWISGDTVLYEGVRNVAKLFEVGTAVLHLGSVQFPLTGPVRYTMTAQDAVELCGLLHPTTVLPVHYEGWSHFRQGRDAIAPVFAAAPAEVRDSLHWLPMGVGTEIEV